MLLKGKSDSICSQSDFELNVTRTLDRVIRHSNALDTETLCIMKGQSCWGIRADVHVTNYDGNLIDCACIGIMTSLQHFRCPDAVVKDGKVSVYSIDERVPIPLNLTHRPLTITFHTFHDGELLLMDATRKEELAAEGDMVIALNDDGQVCAVYKTAGRPVGAVDVMRKTSIALQKVQEINNIIQKALDDDQSQRTRRNVGVEANSANDRWSQLPLMDSVGAHICINVCMYVCIVPWVSYIC